MLVNSVMASMLDDQKVAQFGRSPYDGLAVAFSPVFDSSQVPSSGEISQKINGWRKISKKDIWPWVYLNRMIAVDDAQNDPHTAGNPYFHRIVGVDLEDRAGAESDFLRIWANSLRAARDSQVPGIVFDPEFYNFYKEYDPTVLAVQIGKKPDEVLDLLKKLGAQMADTAAAQYPDATLWFLATGFTHPGYKGAGNRHYFLSITYIAMGLLDEIENRHYRLKVLSGGEISLGYCHAYLQQFQQEIKDRATGFAPELQKYAGTLDLGGTLTLWGDAAAKRGWVAESDCARCPAANVEELQPYLELLLKSYRYNWIYGSMDAGYDAFDSRIAPRFDAVIRKAEASVLGRVAPQSGLY